METGNKANVSSSLMNAESFFSTQLRRALRQMEKADLLRKLKPSPKYEIRPLATPTRSIKSMRRGQELPGTDDGKGVSASPTAV